ncbi:MAG: amidophosphoribosyltransferase [Pseudomonadota bacterium]
MDFFDDDKLHEECGIFGIFNHEDAAAITTLGLHSLQHRGQEAAGIVTFDSTQFHAERHRGLIGDNFTKKSVLDRLKGHRSIGHVRYSTTGADEIRNVQPFFAEFSGGGFSVAHNGNITNGLTLRRELQRQGAIFQSTSDTEVLLHMLAMSKEVNFVERLQAGLRRLEGAFSFVGMTNKKLIGCRDPHGIRPLVLGDLEGSYILASETCALDIIGARHVRDIKPGELVIINDNGIRSLYPFPETQTRLCLFEYVYFARPDSIVEGKSVYDVRKQIGIELAKEQPTDADMVVPVPDSGVPAAIGYAQGAGLPFELGIIRNHYVGRTFIQPTDSIRHMGVKLKHNANRKLLEGKNVVLVDDSIVRGTTSKKIVQMVREAGAASVHMRVASPPITSPDFYGVDTPDPRQLLASRMTIEEMRDYIRVDTLGFVSLDGLYRALGEKERNNENPQYNDSCFSGDYPTPLTDYEDRDNISNISLLAEAKG